MRELAKDTRRCRASPALEAHAPRDDELPGSACAEIPRNDPEATRTVGELLLHPPAARLVRGVGRNPQKVLRPSRFRQLV